ncbi:MAG: phosphoribosylamine--glycine ligase [Actinobacteria bacterium]|nr:phosphoribosylamine--glycine ligase [Actinomycetota bacterium]
MRVVVVGSGGREHALAAVLSRDAEVVVTPGNPAMSRASGLDGSGAITVTDAGPEQIDADLYVIGPEAPLVDGLADRLRAAGRSVFGPGADGARLEGSKAFMKQLLLEAGVPTAQHRAFDAPDPAIAYLRERTPPYVVKTDGLAAGKGVLVTDDLAAAEADVRAKLAGESFGDAGRRIVIEEGMVGTELSILAVCDGTRAVALAPARDFKRVGDGDTGPNTGGMGAYSPVAEATPALVDEIMATIVVPTVSALRVRGIDYRGVLYAGLMLTAQGPKIIEYNVRFGDPETQVVVPRMTSSLTELLASAAAGELTGEPTFDDGAAVTVVAASEGYPAAPRTGDVIDGLDDAIAVTGAAVLGAGVGADGDGRLVTAGGRVLDVCGFGPDLATARGRAYEALGYVSWPGMHHRNDIATAS